MTATEASTVHQFVIGEEPATTRYAGSGIAPGRVLNQFSKDRFRLVIRLQGATAAIVNVPVDTSVWSLALRRAKRVDDAAPRELAELISEGRVVLLGPVRQELLSCIKVVCRSKSRSPFAQVGHASMITTCVAEPLGPVTSTHFPQFGETVLTGPY